MKSGVVVLWDMVYNFDMLDFESGFCGSMPGGRFYCLAALAAAVYLHPMNAPENPDYQRRAVKPPSLELFGGRPHFMSMRVLPQSGWREQLDATVERDRLGDVVWAAATLLANTNLAEQVAELKRRGYFLFDVWGPVPGTNDGSLAGTVDRRHLEMFERELGERWLGMDCGEMDGRFVSPLYGFAHQREPLYDSSEVAYLDFQHFFEEYFRRIGNKVSALVSHTCGHYFAQQGCLATFGAETAQSLPNAQIYYAFLRGAGKQYGIPWFGNASVFNHWGVKGYPRVVNEKAAKVWAPDRGTSLALLKKLMYAQILYGCNILGFECSWYMVLPDGTQKLSPIGEIQQGAADWSARNGPVGVQHVPVALMFEFMSGWTYPRSHYLKEQVFQNWGSVPWNLGDFFADGVLNEVYPGYEASGFWRDERGFNCDTPFGDSVDCVLSDAPAWMLAQYPVVILANKMRPSAETAATLREYVRQGGHLVYTRGNRDILFPEGFGPCGKGRVTEIPSAWGVNEQRQCPLPIVSDYEKPFPSPHPLLPESRRIIREVLRENVLFTTSPEPSADGLAIVTACRGKGEYTVAVLNNTWEPRPLKIYSHAGEIASLTELPTPDDVKGKVGYHPNTMTNLAIGADTPTQIAAGSTRLFRVRLRDTGAVRELPKVSPAPNAAGRALALRVPRSFRDEVLLRPTFFRHWDAVTLDWRYLRERDIAELKRQTNWLKLQGLNVIVDLRSGLNQFPDIRFANKNPEGTESEAMLDETLEKAAVLGVHDIVISPVRYDWYMDGYKKHQIEGIRRFADKAAAKGIVLHMHFSWWRGRYQGYSSFGNVKKLVEEIGRPNVKLSPSVADQLWANNGDTAKTAAEIASSDSGIVFVSAPRKDEFGNLVSASEPLSALPQTVLDKLLPVLRSHKGRIVFDAVYPDKDAEWRDAILMNLATKSKE